MSAHCSMTPSNPSCCGGSSAPPHVVVIGSGGAAMGAALEAVERGARVTLIERGRLGGTCVNVGCVPSKALIRAAEAVHRATHSAFDGITVQGQVVDARALARQRQRLVDSLQQAKYADVLAGHPGITVIQGQARFVDGSTLAVGDRRIPFTRCVVATGARPALPLIPGLAAAEPWDSTAALAAEVLPRSLVILGGRTIAIELGQAFARLGVQVTLIQRSPRLLPELDAEVAATITTVLRDEGLTVHTSVTVDQVSGGPGAVQVTLSTGQVLSAERVLCALGRAPNTDALGAEAAGLAVDAQGHLVVDAQLRTSNPKVFAAGDVIGDPAVVYAAAYEGRLAARNALGASRGESRDEAVMPVVIFSDPQIATVGLSEEAARARGIAVAVATLPLTQLPRALAARDTRGFLKLIKEADGDRLLGAVFVAPEAGDLIMEPTLAIRYGLTVTDLIDTFHPYLTQAEGVRLAAQGFQRDLSTLSCCA